MKRKNLKEFNPKFTANSENYMAAFRKNVFAYVSDKDITLNQIAEEADIPYSTLKTFLYGDSKDCNLSTAVKLARAFGVSVDRLIGAGTIAKETLDFAQSYTKLPKPSQALIRWHVENQTHLYQEHKDKRFISIMHPICNGNGNLKQTNDYSKLDITDLGEELTHRIYFGVKIPCDHYLPHYTEGQILLVANDRNAMKGENTVIVYRDNIMITRRMVENGEIKYYGLMDNIFRTNELDSIQVVGYVAKALKA